MNTPAPHPPAKTCLCMNLPRYKVCDALPHPRPCLRTCIPFTQVFFIRTQFKTNSVCPSSPPPATPLWIRPCLHYDLIAAVTQWNPTGAEQIISWPNRKETLIISIKLQPNVIHSQVGVISVRNRISRLKKLCIIKPIWRIRHFVDQQTINAWRIRPRIPLKLYIYVELLKKNVLRVIKWAWSLYNKTEMAIGFGFKWNINLLQGITRVITFRIDLLCLHSDNSELRLVLSATREHANSHKPP